MTKYSETEQWDWLENYIDDGFAVCRYNGDLWIDVPSVSHITHRSRQRIVQLVRDQALRSIPWRNSKLINVSDLINYTNRLTYQAVEKARGRQVKPFVVKRNDDYGGI